ncbi:MAG: LD-carboxypeptidase [Bacteroidota bacterium]
MITPPYLQKGDKIAIVSTARKISETEISAAINYFKNKGFEVVLGNTIGAESNQFAGNDELRVKDFQQFLDDANIKAIVCARGGYGTMRIIDALDFSKFKQNPKWIIGYSDVTVLHSHLQHVVGVKSIHASMPINFVTEGENEAMKTLHQALTGNLKHYEFENNNSLNKKGNAKAELVGGNLSLIYALQGSVTDINTDGKVLFLEDLDEYLYHIDRMLLSLKRSGKLSKLKGLIIGGMSDMKDNTIPFGKTAEEIIFDAVKEYNYPVCFNFPAGHIEQNLALIMGAEISLTVDEKCSVSF